MYRQSEPLHGRPPPRRRGHDVVAGGSTSGVTPEGQGWPRGLSFGGRLCCQPTITCTTCWWMHGGGADRHAALAPMARWLRQRAVGKRVARHLEAVAVSMDRRRSPDTAKPRRWLLRSSGRRGSRCRGPGRRWWPELVTPRSLAGRRNGARPFGRRRPVTEDRLSAAFLSGVWMAFPPGIDGAIATPGGQGRGVNFHLAPNPYQALGLGGRYRHGPSRWCATGDPAAKP